MDKKDFTKSSGKLVKNDKNCYSFVPNKLPRKLTLDPSLTTLLINAHTSLGTLSGYGVNLPDPNLLIGPYLRNEAVESSKIEGTKASLEDLVRYEAGEELQKDMGQVDIKEVDNYVKAMEEGLEDIRKNKKIKRATILGIHKTLMKDVRCLGRPGKIRDIQNFIGLTDIIELATFIPPPVEYIEELLDDLFDFIQNPPKDIPPLVQVALIHYQFEAIHPFMDGNGRIGRLLITLYLCEKKHLSQPLIYLSEFLEKNKPEYKHRLLKVSQESQWTEYIRFFLTAVDVQARKSNDNIKELKLLSEDYHERVGKESMTTHTVVQFLFARPATSINDISQVMNVTYMTAKKIVRKLEDTGILKEITGRKRGKIYLAKDILDIIDPPKGKSSTLQ